MPAERRILPRFAPSKLVVLTLCGQQVPPVYGLLSDISETGARIVTDSDLPLGGDVQIKICFSPQVDNFETAARVVWSAGSDPAGIEQRSGSLQGVQFTGLSRAKRNVLRGVQNLVSPQPAPRVEARVRVDWRNVGLLVLAMVLAAGLGVAFLAFQQVSEVSRDMDMMVDRVERDIRQLHSGIGFESRRQVLLDGIRDELMRVHPAIDDSRARHYAGLVLDTADRYPAVEPTLVLAMSVVEGEAGADSGYAPGLFFRIPPDTGKKLARALGWEYSEKLMRTPEKNLEMAIMHLNLLLSTYNDLTMVLAEFHGGPLDAQYVRTRGGGALETRRYVGNVLRTYKNLTHGFTRRLQHLSDADAEAP